jgi:hypothetical protein
MTDEKNPIDSEANDLSPEPVAPAATPSGIVDDEDAGQLYLDEPDDEPQGVPVPAPKAADEEEAPKPPRPDALNVKQQHEVYRAILPTDDVDELIMLPAGTNDEINVALAATPNVRLDDTEQTREWAFVLNEGTKITQIGSAFEASVRREDSMWVQEIPSELGVLAGAAPQFKDKPGVLLTGERAVLRLRHLTGQGSVYQVPLWHSGFWVTFKAPSDGAILELQRRIMQEKIDLGRHVHGLAFSNHSVYTAGWMTDFALNHIYDTNIKDIAPEQLRELIVSLDLPSVFWGIACVQWPNGFKYAQACANDPSKCQEVVRELIDVTKLQWCDQRVLTPWQVSHMASRNKKVTLDQIEKYRSEFVVGKPRVVELAPGVKATLKVPTVADYLTSGNKWVGAIVQMIDKAFSLSPEDGQRNQFITEQGQASTMRQFGHWLQELELPGDQKITDQETLEMSLDSLSGKEKIVDNFLNAVGKFMDEATSCVIAIPTHDCPKCGHKRGSNLPRYPHLLPLDVMATFFILLGQKATSIRNR